MDAKVQRRHLKFESFADVLREVDTLHRGGYQRLGNWDLSQISRHLVEWLRFPLDGSPRQGRGVRVMLWMMRNTVGKRILRRILNTGAMPAGGPTLKQTISAHGGDEAEAVELLRKAIARFEAHTGPVHPSPMFGVLDQEQRKRLQLVHCAHHLGFLQPNAEANPSA